MIDINLIRENKEFVKENIKKKFQDHKLPLVDEVYELDILFRKIKAEGDNLRNEKNKLSSEIGILVREGKQEEIKNVKENINKLNKDVQNLTLQEEELSKKIREIMLQIPNIIDDSVPIGEDDSKNIEVERFGDAKVLDYEIPYHATIMESLSGLDLDSARKVSGNGFYYLTGNIARLHSAILSYARDFMISKGFIYVIPPFMLKGDAVNGVMSFEEKENMMYKIEGEDYI